MYSLLAGLAGIVAHFALGEVRRKLHAMATERAHEQACQVIAGRIHRHIPHLTARRRNRTFGTPHSMPQQYLTVVGTRRMAYR
jgi:hypothetical protein